MFATELKEKKIRNKLKKMSIDKLAATLSMKPTDLKQYCLQKGIKIVNETGDHPPECNTHAKIAKFSWKFWILSHKKILLFLVALVIAAYAGTINHAFVSDDGPAILVQNLSDFSLVTSNPFQSAKPLTYFLTNAIFGKVPWAYRLPNIFAHFLTVLVVFITVELLVNTRAATSAASIIAVHPLLTESVTWISAGGYVSYSLFCLLSLLFFMLRKNSKIYYPISIFSFILALLNSEKAVIYPILLIIYLICFESLKKNWKLLIPFFVFSGIWAAVSLAILPARQEILKTNFSVSEQVLSNPLITIPISVATYLSLLIWPINLSFFHTGGDITLVYVLIRALVLIIFLLILLGFYWHGFRKHTWMKQPAFWTSVFIISLIPTFIPSAMALTVAERYVYLGTVSLIVSLAIILEHWRQKFGKNTEINFFVALVVTFLLIITNFRNIDWQDNEHLAFSTARSSPNNPQNNNNLGDLYTNKKDYDKAAYYFTRATKLHPCYGDAYHNLGNTLVKLQKYEEAIVNYHKSIECKPTLWESHHHLAFIYNKLGDLTNASLEIDKALQINPTSPELHKLKAEIDKQRQP